jgi:hypothetical protein
VVFIAEFLFFSLPEQFPHTDLPVVAFTHVIEDPFPLFVADVLRDVVALEVLVQLVQGEVVLSSFVEL